MRVDETMAVYYLATATGSGCGYSLILTDIRDFDNFTGSGKNNYTTSYAVRVQTGRLTDENPIRLR